MKWGWLVALVVLSGCATASKTFGPDGKPAYAVTCSGSALSWDACYQKAGQMCGSSGYEVAAKDDDHGTIVLGTRVQNRTMMVECKRPS